MSPEQQEHIVTQLCNSLRDKILARIREGDIPSEWDGLELRQLVAEMFWNERTIARRSGCMRPDIKRAQDFRFHVMVGNLDR